nr:ATP-binding protein [uncultured Actinoplanes sp.]
MSASAAWLSAVHVESDIDAAVALMAVRGTWNRPLCKQVTGALQKCLAEHPEALIVDLSELDDPTGLSAPTWVTARNAAVAKEPPVQLALCIPPDLPLADRVQRLGSRRWLPVYAKVRQARVAIASRLPPAERLTLRLRPEAEAPSLARNLVSDACLTWDLQSLLHPARALMSELVTNAVEHARTDLMVVASLRGRGLHLIVADGLPTPPRLLPRARPKRGQPLDERGRGLQTVAALATAWGSLPTRSGKIVWAALQPASGHDAAPPQRRRPPRNDDPFRRRVTEPR